MLYVSGSQLCALAGKIAGQLEAQGLAPRTVCKRSLIQHFWLSAVSIDGKSFGLMGVNIDSNSYTESFKDQIDEINAEANNRSWERRMNNLNTDVNRIRDIVLSLEKKVKTTSGGFG
jgi:hypothetical protein